MQFLAYPNFNIITCPLAISFKSAFYLSSTEDGLDRILHFRQMFLNPRSFFGKKSIDFATAHTLWSTNNHGIRSQFDAYGFAGTINYF